MRLIEKHLPRRLKARFTLIALVCAAAIFLCIAPLTVWQGRQLLLDRRVQDMQVRLDAAIGKGYAEMRAIRQQAMAITDIVQQWKPKGVESWYGIMEEVLHLLPKACAVRFAFEPASVFGPPGVRTLYVQRGVGEGKTSRGSLGYDPGDPASPGAKWYAPVRDRPLAFIDGYWSDSYVAPETGLRPVFTCTVPIGRDVGGRSVLDGVVAVDLESETILQSLVGLDLEREFQVFVLDAGYSVVAVARGGVDAGLPGGSQRDLALSKPDAMKPFQQLRAQDKRAGWFVSKNPYNGVESFFLFERFPRFPILFVCVIAVSRLSADVWWLAGSVSLLGLVGLGGMGLLIRWSAGRVTRNLDVLRQGVRNVRAGNLREQLPSSSTHDETADIIDAFNGMVCEVEAAFQRTKEMVRKQQHLATELELAKNIQQSVLPRPMRPVGGSMFCLSVPAQEVGGDFFDHFVLPGGRTVFAVGDVSGKGISAAMFMVRVSLLLRSAAIGMDPQDAVAQVNAMLVESNPQMMFVTLFLAVWDPRAQSISWVNAGHNPPVLLREDGSVEFLSQRSGPAVGALRGKQYAVWDTPFREGDILAVYTDGISEAPNAADEQFGTGRLSDFLLQNRERPLRGCALDLVEQVVGWQGGGERFDDITLALVRAERPSRSLRLAASVDTVEQVVDLVDSSARGGGMDGPAAREMALAACEAATNVVVHSLRQDAGRSYSVFASWSEGDFVVRVEDDGPPFDPDALPPVDVGTPLAERPFGGLGWHLIRQSTDEVRMERVSETNVLTLVRSRNRPTIGNRQTQRRKQ